VRLYAALHFLWPAASLALVAALDRSEGRAIRLAAAASTALLLPLTFGFPTELWIAHAAFWPALALLHAPEGPQRAGAGRRAATALALTATVCAHEGGAIWAAVAAAALAARPDRRRALPAGLALLGLALVPWVALKALARPEPYVAEVLGRNALHLADPLALVTPLTVLLGAAVAIFGALAFLWRRRPGGAWLAAAAVAAALAVWWGAVDPFLHAADRYRLRTVLVGAVPLMALAATLPAARAALAGAPAGLARAALAALALVGLIHAVETAKFARAFDAYAGAVAALAAGPEADPELGDRAFVSAARLGAAHRRLGWHSTTPFLSALAAPGFAPARLLVDPTSNYFWLSCATAAANAAAPRALPTATRALVEAYSCLHRP
jgi:hypothetical protein